MTMDIKEAAAIMGRKGGKVKSEKKTAALRRNIKLRWDRVKAAGNSKDRRKAARAVKP